MSPTLAPNMRSPRGKVPKTKTKSNPIPNPTTFLNGSEIQQSITRTRDKKTRPLAQIQMLMTVKNSLLNSIHEPPETFKNYYLSLLNERASAPAATGNEIIQRQVFEDPDCWAYLLLTGEEVPSVIQDPVIKAMKEKLYTFAYYYYSLPLEYLFLGWKPNVYRGNGTQALTTEIVSREVLSKQLTRFGQCSESMSVMVANDKSRLSLLKELLDATKVSLVPVENSADSAPAPPSFDQTVAQENKLKSINKKLLNYLDTTLNKLQRRGFITSKNVIMELVRTRSLSPGILKKISPNDIEFLLNDVKVLRRRTIGGKFSLILNEFDG